MSRSKFTEGTRSQLLEALRRGVPIRTACALAGVDRGTFYHWVRRGEAGRPGGVFHTFTLDVGRAIAEADSEAVVIVRQGMRDDPRLAWRWIERRLREDFGPEPPVPMASGPLVVQLTLSDGQPVHRPLPTTPLQLEGGDDEPTPA